jgi:phage N-6-adenine-methyltransferase
MTDDRADLVVLADRKVAVFDPSRVRAGQAKLDALITYAMKVKDERLLAEAVDAKIAEQAEFVAWWDVSVRRPGQGNNSDHELFSRDDAEARTGILQPQVSRWRKLIADAPRYRDRVLAAAFSKAGMAAEANHRAEGTGENEWFTPAQYVAAARKVMGAIDLDPATHRVAQEAIQATECFTREDDALAREWRGRVWLNPPYAQPLIGQFVGKLVEEIEAGRVKQAVLLTHNYTDTAWFHAAQAGAAMICFTRGRIKFVDINGDDCAPTQGQSFFYYGPRVDRFRREFAPFGFVVCHA